VAGDAESLMRLHIFSTAAPLTTRRPDCPTGVAALVAELMSKVPDQRPQRAEEVAARIYELRNPPDPAYRATVVTGYGTAPWQPDPAGVVVPPSQERSTIVVGDEPPRGPQPGGTRMYPQGEYPSGPYQQGPGAYQAPPGGYAAGAVPGGYAAGAAPYQQGPAPYQAGPAPSAAAVAAWRGDRPEIQEARARARYRLYWLLTAGLGIVAIAAVALLVLTGHKALTVKSLSVAAPKAAGCNGTVDVVATVVTDGNAGTVSYQWSRSDGTDVQRASVDVSKGTTSTPIHLQWTFHGKANFHGTATLKILSPGSATASAPVTYTCK
ncbi:MAG TPA: hypothetical protein VKB69_02220, partial [Micromonosporaceae bacterium]|nr:hypothetical protein [Micromonosporaceae bacterium]